MYQKNKKQKQIKNIIVLALNRYVLNDFDCKSYSVVKQTANNGKEWMLSANNLSLPILNEYLLTLIRNTNLV